MKRSVIYSIILHGVILILALFYIPVKKQEPPQSFVARIITPEELQEKEAKPPPAQRHAMPRERIYRMPRLPKDLPPPKELWAVPKLRAPGKGDKESPGQEQNKGNQGELAKKSADVPPQNQGGAAPDRKDGISSALQGRQHEPVPLSPKALKERLFDKSVIGQLAKKEKGNVQPDSSITFETKDYKYYGYMQRLKEKIEGIWKYPADAAERGLSGDLYIRFTIRRDGKLAAVELVRTSGYKHLDDAAIRALRDAEPYWPLPEAWGEDNLTITGHFVYSLQGIYIR